MYCGPQISQVSHVEGVRSACHSTGENVIHVHSMEEGALPMEDRCFQSTRAGDERESLDDGEGAKKWALSRTSKETSTLNPVKLPGSQKIQLSYFKPPQMFLIW